MKKEIAIVVLFFAVLLVLGIMTDAYAWTPLVDATMFTGITVDVTTAAVGIITVCVVVLGVFLIIKAMSH